MAPSFPRPAKTERSGGKRNVLVALTEKLNVFGKQLKLLTS